MLTTMKKPLPIILFAIMASTISGCMESIEINEPSQEQYVEANRILNETYLSPPRDIHPFRMQATVNRIAPRIRSASYRVCLDLQRSQYHCDLIQRSAIYIHQNNPQINAAADENSDIHLFGGLINISGSDDEVAAVLAHEFAHVMFVHVDKKYMNALIGQSIALALVSDNATPESQQYWADLGAGFGATAYSPEMELEADRAAVYILLYAGYRPEAMQDFLVRATRESARQANMGIYTVSFLQTHPSDNNRMAHLVSAIQDARIGRPLVSTGY